MAQYNRKIDESKNRKMVKAHRAFTLLEILTVVAIIAIMVTASVVSVRQGQGAARIRGATRDIYATIRHARSMALVSQRESKITYSCSTEADTKEAISKIEIKTAKMFVDNAVKVAETLFDGEKVNLADDEPAVEDLQKAYTVNGEDPTVQSDFKGQTVEESLLGGGNEVKNVSNDEIEFSPVSEDVLRGIRIKVTREGETLDGVVDTRRKSKISVFYAYDGRTGSYEAGKDDDTVSFSGESDQAPVEIKWEPNGRTEPHRVWIFADGSSPEKGLSIKIDRFGGAKVIGSGEDDR